MNASRLINILISWFRSDARFLVQSHTSYTKGGSIRVMILGRKFRLLIDEDD